MENEEFDDNVQDWKWQFKVASNFEKPEIEKKLHILVGKETQTLLRAFAKGKGKKGAVPASLQPKEPVKLQIPLKNIDEIALDNKYNQAVDQVNFKTKEEVQKFKKPTPGYIEVLGTDIRPKIWKPSKYKFNPAIRIKETI